jgi:hypothetical protein
VSADRWRLGLAGVLALHCAAVLWLVSPADLLSGRPLAAADYSVHYYEARNVREHLARAGSIWGYNPYWMAGYPEGALGLIDNKLFMALGAAAPRGLEAEIYNLGVIAAMLVPPLAGFAAARLAGLDVRPSSAAALLSSVVTFTVPVAVFFWSGGGVSFFLASALSTPAVAGLGFAAETGLFRSRPAMWSLVWAALALFVHPGLLPVIAAAVLVFVGLRRPIHRMVAEGAVIGFVLLLPIVPVAFAVSKTASQMRTYLAADFLQGGGGRLVQDWIVRAFTAHVGWDGGAGGLLAIAMLAAVGWELGPAGPRRSIFAAAAACFGLSYAGTHLGLYSIQPYRYSMPLAFLLSVPAAAGLSRVAQDSSKRRPLALIVAAAALVAIVQAGGTILPRIALGTGVDPAEAELAAFLGSHSASGDRILVESPWAQLPAFAGTDRRIPVQRFRLLPLAIDREFLGNGTLGALHAHRYTAFGGGRLFGRRLEDLGDAELAEILGRYDISWVAALSRPTVANLRRRASILAGAGRIRDVKLFRVRTPSASRVLEGNGTVVASLDRIDVTGARGDRLVLEYHWLPTLRAIPDLRLEEAPQPGAPVGFIAVYPEGKDTFRIVQGGT